MTAYEKQRLHNCKSSDKPIFLTNTGYKLNNDSEMSLLRIPSAYNIVGNIIYTNNLKRRRYIISERRDRQMDNAITITDPKIIEFFNTSVIDPTKFILLAIQNKQLLVENKSTTSNPSEKTDISKTEFFKLKQDYIGFKETQSDIRDKINEIIEIIDSQKLPFLEQQLISSRVMHQKMYKCLFCNKKTFATKRALAGHTNRCRPLHELEENDEEETEEITNVEST
jgi:hypothetical protein